MSDNTVSAVLPGLLWAGCSYVIWAFHDASTFFAAAGSGFILAIFLSLPCAYLIGSFIASVEWVIDTYDELKYALAGYRYRRRTRA